VDKGEKIDNQDLEFLEMVHDDAIKNQGMIELYPEVKEYVMKAIDLYAEITSKALENEQKD
jgi:hypothetical protein